MDTPFSFLRTGLDALERAVDARGSALRNVQLATVAADGGPALRTAILRGFSRDPAVLELHSDARANKIGEIERNHRVAVLAWSAEPRLQLRLDGAARLHRADALARERWDALPGKARLPYGLRAHPGAPVADPEARPHLPPAERFELFVVIRVMLERVDVLRLEPDGGQRRASGRFGADDLAARWIGP